jgi:hypothetical protein
MGHHNHTLLWLLSALLFLASPSFATENDSSQEEQDTAKVRWRQSLANTEVYLLKNDTPYFADMVPELTEAVDDWLNAIAQRDVKGIMKFVLTEGWDGIEKALNNPSHLMHQYLLGDESRVYKLAQSPTREVVLVRKGTKWAPGPGISACIFDRAQHDPQTDAEHADIYRKQADGTFCWFFFHADDHWRFNVDVFFEEPGL